MSLLARTRPWPQRMLLVSGAAVLFMAALFSFPGESLARSSADTSDSTSVSTAVGVLSGAGILRGRDSSSMIPREYVTRAQLAVFLARALDLEESTTPPPFIDVADSAWYAGAVGAMHKAGLVRGVTYLAFAPDEPVSRQQAVAWIIECLDFQMASDEMFAQVYEQVGYPLDTTSESMTALRQPSLGMEEAWLGVFQDRSLIDPAYSRSVASGYRLGVVDPYADGWFYPDLPLSWGDMAVMLDRAFVHPVWERREHPTSALTPQASYPVLDLDSEGPLVWYIEDRLRSLNYRPGPIDGVYDDRTRDAVLAFQKVERLHRDGIAGPSFWEQIFSAETPSPKFAAEGTRVEIDLTRQVLFVITDNKVWKIVHTSTGRSHGTPAGRGKVGTKQTGWNWCPVGWMYYVSYIMPHIAIHGMPSVPAYPASHGCVRVPMWMAIELFYELPKGTRVDVYYN